MATEFLWGLLSIILIDLVLAGDNALVIASATRKLEGRTRRLAMLFGTIAAAVLRIVFLLIASWLLELPYLYLVGGAYIIFVAFKLLSGRESDGCKSKDKSGEHIFEAAWIIGSADALMSMDNVLAVAGASGGNYRLFILGVLISVPIIFFAATLLSRLMQRYPVVILIGSLVLARVGGKMIAEERIFGAFMTDFWNYAIQGIAMLLVLGFYFFKRCRK